MASIEIEQVTIPEPPAGGHGRLDAPMSGELREGFVLKVSGWAVGEQSPVAEVELVEGGRLVRRAPVEQPRPDVANVHPELAGAERSGFAFGLGVLGLPSPFELEVEAVSGEERWPLAVVRGRRSPLQCEYAPALEPLMVTSIGRTGTTLLMRLLSAHPEVVVYDKHPYEIRCASYWLHALRVLAEPGVAFDAARWMPYLNGLESVLMGNPFTSPPVIDDGEVARWAADEHVHELAAFCRRSVDDFYGQVALAQGVGRPRRFAEKLYPSLLADVLAEVDGSTLELVSVRDPRDVLSSLLATGWWTGFFGGADLRWLVARLGEDFRPFVEGWRRRRERAWLVRYEDLATRPEETVEAALAFAGLDASPATVERMVRHGFEDIPEARAHRTTETMEASVGRWRRDLDPALQELCADLLSEAVAAFGYEA